MHKPLLQYEQKNHSKNRNQIPIHLASIALYFSLGHQAFHKNFQNFIQLKSSLQTTQKMVLSMRIKGQLRLPIFKSK